MFELRRSKLTIVPPVTVAVFDDRLTAGAEPDKAPFNVPDRVIAVEPMLKLPANRAVPDDVIDRVPETTADPVVARIVP